MKFCGEIKYDHVVLGGFSMKLCWCCGNGKSLIDKPMTDDYRKYLHHCLDEWISSSKGTGHFVLYNSDTTLPLDIQNHSYTIENN